MTTYILIIKGDIYAAREAARIHNITLGNVDPQWGSNETHSHGEGELNDVINWFNRDSIDGAMPAGTLLWFSELERVS